MKERRNLVFALCGVAFVIAVVIFAVLFSYGSGYFLNREYGSKNVARSIYISPSLQERNLYTDGVTSEEENMRKVGIALQSLLGNDFTVFISGEDMSLSEAIADSNSKSPGIHIALHSNASGLENSSVRGCEVYTRNNKTCKYLANCVYDSLSALTPTADRGVKLTDSLLEVNTVNAVCILVEADFHDCVEGSEWLKQNVDSIAEAIASGVFAFYGE